MSRHIADHRAQSDGGRLKAYLQIDRTGGDETVHPKVRELHKRPASRKSAARVTQYVRIEREGEA